MSALDSDPGLYEEQRRIRREDTARRVVARRWDLHICGVHVECRPKGSYGGDSPTSCLAAGTVERFHAHGYEGPLVCGCDDFSTEGP